MEEDNSDSDEEIILSEGNLSMIETDSGLILLDEDNLDMESQEEDLIILLDQTNLVENESTSTDS